MMLIEVYENAIQNEHTWNILVQYRHYEYNWTSELCLLQYMKMQIQHKHAWNISLQHLHYEYDWNSELCFLKCMKMQIQNKHTFSTPSLWIWLKQWIMLFEVHENAIQNKHTGNIPFRHSHYDYNWNNELCFLKYMKMQIQNKHIFSAPSL